MCSAFLARFPSLSRGHGGARRAGSGAAARSESAATGIGLNAMEVDGGVESSDDEFVQQPLRRGKWTWEEEEYVSYFWW